MLFFPSSFRRAVKFGQRDAASEILRTEVLAMLTTIGPVAPMVVSYPEAIAERVVSKKTLDDRTLQIHVGEQVDILFVEQTLLEFGFLRLAHTRSVILLWSNCSCLKKKNLKTSF